GATPTLTPRWLPALLLAATGVVVLTSYLAGGAGGIPPVDDPAGFSLEDDAWRQSSRPLFDTPDAIERLPSSVLTRTSIAIARGRRTAVRDFAAVAAALASVAFAVMLFRSGVPLFSALLASLGLALGATFWSRGTAWTLDALAPLCALIAVVAGQRWRSDGSAIAASVTAVAATLATVEDPTWIACLPAATVLIWTRRPRVERLGSAMVAGLLLLGALATIVERIAILRHAPWVELLRVETPTVWSLWVMRCRDELTSLTSMLSQELTPLGLVLCAIGVAVTWAAKRGRLALALLIVAVLTAREIMPQLQPERAGPVVAIVGWSLVAIGLQWVNTARPGAAPMLAGIAGLMLIAQPSLTLGRVTGCHA